MGDTVFYALLFLFIIASQPKNRLAEIYIKVYNQKDEIVLTNVTEAIVKCKQTEK